MANGITRYVRDGEVGFAQFDCGHGPHRAYVPGPPGDWKREHLEILRDAMARSRVRDEEDRAEIDRRNEILRALLDAVPFEGVTE